MDVHDLTAAYALDALEPAEADEYEDHLGQCEECRAQLAELNESATALAFGVPAPAPPARLRESILAAAAAERANAAAAERSNEAVAERSNVIPFRQRRWTPRVLAVAAAAACVSVGFGIASLQSSRTHVLSTAVVLAADHSATLQIDGLARAPQGKTYEAWIIPRGSAPRPAGTFAGGAASSVTLQGKLPPHAVVAVTVEPAGGDTVPTTAPLVEART